MYDYDEDVYELLVHIPFFGYMQSLELYGKTEIVVTGREVKELKP